jgi:hypothetical protein
MIKPIMEFFHFVFEIFLFLLEEKEKGFKNIYNNHDK